MLEVMDLHKRYGTASALGGVSRYWIGGIVQRSSPGTFPIGTLIVNLTGSFLIGLILQYSLESGSMNQELRVFLTIGFCGGYTTFSSFSWETLQLLQNGEWGRAGLYVVGSVALGLLATGGGMAVARGILLKG